MKRAEQTIRQHNLIPVGSIIGCAVSGGSDSMCLLHYLTALSRHSGEFSVVCINVEHGIRGETSLADSAFVQDYCKSSGIEFVGTSVDAPAHAAKNKQTLELAARELRYGFFKKLMSEGVCHAVAVAHNRNDNAESVLMHIFRGSGSGGASGMEYSINGIIRPLLDTDKREILQYLSDNNVCFIDDETNKDNSYTRNFVRNQVLPLVESRYTGAAANIVRFAAIVKEEDDYLNAQAQKSLYSGRGGWGAALPLEPVLLRRALILCCRKLGVFTDITQTNLRQAAQLAEVQPGTAIDLGSGLCALREQGGIFITEPPHCSYAERHTLPFKEGDWQFCGYQIKIERSERPSSFADALYVDADSFPRGSEFRFRRQGDRFRRYKGKDKLLSDYFTDIGLPKRLRDCCPLIASKNQVLVVLAADISHGVRLTQKTKNIYKITFSGGAASELIQRCRKDTNNQRAD